MRIHQYGGPEALTLEDLVIDDPGPGQARIRLEAAGVNFADVYQRRGLYPIPLPATLGTEGGGIVEAIGPDVTEVAVGDRVVYAGQLGSYSEQAIVTASRLVPVPEAMDIQRATAVMAQGLTAHCLSHSVYPLRPGDIALVHAAAGGVGHLLVQMAKRRGARVIATASTEEKARLARESGADEIILYTQHDFEEETKRLTENKGVNVVYDSVGQSTFDKSINCLQPRGYMVLYGQSSGPVAPFDPQILNAKGSLFLTRPRTGHYIVDRDELLRRSDELFSWIMEQELVVRIDRTFPLALAADAHRFIEGRKTRGKLLLLPSQFI